MQVRSTFRRMRLWAPDPALVRMLCLAGCVALGMAAGGFWAARSGGGGDFAAYLNDFCGLYAEGPAAVSLPSAVRLYFGYSAAAWLLGFASLGVVLLPVLAAAYGFTAMFAVACFTQAFGRRGAVMALGAMGLRHLVVLPCFLWIAAQAWASADRLLALTLGRGKRCSAPTLDGGYWYRLCLCVALLFVGLCLELYVAPSLFALTLGG